VDEKTKKITHFSQKAENLTLKNHNIAMLDVT
jgi:hypothetical protein